MTKFIYVDYQNTIKCWSYWKYWNYFT